MCPFLSIMLSPVSRITRMTNDLKNWYAFCFIHLKEFNQGGMIMDIEGLRKGFVAVLLAILIVGSTGAASTRLGSNPITTGTFIKVANGALPAVVSIKVKKTVAGTTIIGPRGKMGEEELKKFLKRRGFQRPDENAPLMPFFFPFFEEKELEIPASGSGMIIRHDGYIVTNYHVIANAREGNITVKLNDDTTFEGDDVKVVGEDTLTDLAVIKVNTKKDLSFLDFADSDKLDIGEWVLALGSPLDLKGSVTQGIISAKHREIGKAPIEDLLQTTAVINPGNSGGPLVNLDGRIVGINTAIATNTGRWQGVGFSIPSNTVKSVSESIISTGKAERGWLGIYMAEVTPRILDYYGLKDVKGILVSKVIEDSPAQESGIKAYDLVTAVNGKSIKNRLEMVRQIARKAVGTRVEITLYRMVDGKVKETNIEVKLGERPAERELKEVIQGKEAPLPREFDSFGIKFKPKAPDSTKEGLEIEAVKPGSPADKARLEAGDILLELNRQKISSIDDFQAAAKKVRKGRDHIVMYQRGNEILFSTIERK